VISIPRRKKAIVVIASALTTEIGSKFVQGDTSKLTVGPTQSKALCPLKIAIGEYIIL
jgi:hypothetical protein